MDALVIGPPRGLADALSATLRRDGLDVLQATPADAADAERAAWLLDEAGRPGLVVVVDGAPFAVARELLAAGCPRLVVAAEQRVSVARAGAASGRSAALRALRRDARGRAVAVVALGRSGRRWVQLGGRPEALGAGRAAALVLSRAGARAAVSA